MFLKKTQIQYVILSDLLNIWYFCIRSYLWVVPISIATDLNGFDEQDLYSDWLDKPKGRIHILHPCCILQSTCTLA